MMKFWGNLAKNIIMMASMALREAATAMGEATMVMGRPPVLGKAPTGPTVMGKDAHARG